MGYRRKTEATTQLRRFHEFQRDNSKLIDEIGIPSFVIEDYNHFIYFLMHGETWPNAPFWFGIYNLSVEKRKLYLLMLEKYFEAGCDYPGLMGLTKAEEEELEKKHPKPFSIGRRGKQTPTN